MTPEAKARISIDALLAAAGWHVCDMGQANINAACGVAIREFPLNTGYGSHMAILRPHAESPVNCLAIDMASNSSFKKTTEASTGTAQMTVPFSGLTSNAVGLPPKAEQVRIVTEVGAEVYTNLKRGEALRHAVLQKQFLSEKRG